MTNLIKRCLFKETVSSKKYDFVTATHMSAGLEAYLEEQWFKKKRQKRESWRQLTASAVLFSMIFSFVLSF